MTTNEDIRIAPRPRTPRAPFLLFEVVSDGELISTGSQAQAEWDVEDMTAEARANGDETTTYVARPADLTDCPRGLRGELCGASEHAMHGVPEGER